MPAYWVARSRIIDPVEYKKYTDPLPAIFAKYGGKVLARGGRYQIMEGPDKFHRFVVIEFPTFEQGGGLLHVGGIQQGRGLPPQRRGRGRDRHRRGRRRDAVNAPRADKHIGDNATLAARLPNGQASPENA